MILNTTIKNFMGIEKEVSINCLANNKIKRNNFSIVSNDEEINILKSIGIIGSNGSGKTSILNAFATIKTFITFPFRKSSNNKKAFIEQIKALPEDLLEKILNEFNTLNLSSPNVNHIDEDTMISVEMFIPKEKDNISGYYTYSLTYNSDYRKSGVKEEKLVYRKRYNSKKEIIIFSVNNIIESELGTKLLYENNTLNSENKMISYYRTFGNEIMNKMDFIFNGDTVDIKEFYQKNRKRFSKLCNLADEKIIDTVIEKRDEEEVIAFINNKKNKLYFDQLSEGTRKIIVLGCKIITAIENNKIIFIDELEKSLHPSLANFLVSLIQLCNRNTSSQLFFTTHSIYLALLLDNDQLYYIDNKNDEYNLLSINDAIKKKIITKDKTITAALVDNLLINNPSTEKIKNFISNF